METKICSKCKEEKELCFFSLDKTSKDGIRRHCNECRKIESKLYRENNKEKRKETIKKFYVNNKEKELIRPLLVCYGTEVARKIDPDFWIKRLQKRILNSIENKIICIIPDVRYENETKWIQSQGGFVIHLSRMGQKPANFEEKSNDPIIKKAANYKIRWKTFSDEKETCNYHVNKLFYGQKWSTYGNFK